MGIFIRDRVDARFEWSPARPRSGRSELNPEVDLWRVDFAVRTSFVGEGVARAFEAIALPSALGRVDDIALDEVALLHDRLELAPGGSQGAPQIGSLDGVLVLLATEAPSRLR